MPWTIYFTYHKGDKNEVGVTLPGTYETRKEAAKFGRMELDAARAQKVPAKFQCVEVPPEPE